MIAEELGIKLENVTLKDLGQAKRVIIDKDNTTVVEGAGKKSGIEGRITQIRARSRTRRLITTAKNCKSG